MKKFYAYGLLALLLLLALMGCEEQQWPYYRETGNGGTTQEEKNKPDTQQTEEEDGETQQKKSKSEAVTFDLPEGWIRGINEEDKSPNRAMSTFPSSDGVKPTVLVVAHGGKKATKEEAKSYAKKDHEERMQYCQDAECAYWINHKEMKIGGIDVFISTDVNFYWGANSFSSLLWFEKDGILYSLEFDDPVKDHLEAVTKIIETLHIIEE